MPKINWQLKSDGKTIIDDHKVDATIDNSVISYNDQYATHIVDILNETYERITNDDSLKIFFKDKLLKVKFMGNNLEYDIECSFENLEDKIIITYNIADEEKIITITKGDE